MSVKAGHPTPGCASGVSVCQAVEARTRRQESPLQLLWPNFRPLSSLNALAQRDPPASCGALATAATASSRHRANNLNFKDRMVGNGPNKTSYGPGMAAARRRAPCVLPASDVSGKLLVVCIHCRLDER